MYYLLPNNFVGGAATSSAPCSRACMENGKVENWSVDAAEETRTERRKHSTATGWLGHIILAVSYGYIG